ncbi:MAG: hypothetical protein WAY02_08475 [Burkholderiaceae bacterium]
MEPLTGNILAIYDSSDAETRRAGAEWYAVAHDDCAALARDLGLPAISVIGAAAAISPGMRWSLTIAHVGMLHKAMRNRQRHVVPTYRALFTARARAILRGELPEDVLRGPKVIAFYRSIRARGDCSDVVVDGHAWNIALGTIGPIRNNVTAPRLTDRRYRTCAELYRQAGAARGVTAGAMQATTWIQHRALKGLDKRQNAR